MPGVAELPQELIGWGALAVVTLLMLVLVPWSAIRARSKYSLVGGLLLALAIQYTGVVWLKLWAIPHDPLKVAGIPVILSLTWLSPVIVYSYALKTGRERGANPAVYIIGFAVFAAITQYLLERAGYWQNIRWGVPATLILAVGTHTFLYWLDRVMVMPNRRRG